MAAGDAGLSRYSSKDLNIRESARLSGTREQRSEELSREDHGRITNSSTRPAASRQGASIGSGRGDAAELWNRAVVRVRMRCSQIRMVMSGALVLAGAAHHGAYPGHVMSHAGEDLAFHVVEDTPSVAGLDPAAGIADIDHEFVHAGR